MKKRVWIPIVATAAVLIGVGTSMLIKTGKNVHIENNINIGYDMIVNDNGDVELLYTVYISGEDGTVTSETVREEDTHFYYNSTDRHHCYITTTYYNMFGWTMKTDHDLYIDVFEKYVDIPAKQY